MSKPPRRYTERATCRATRRTPCRVVAEPAARRALRYAGEAPTVDVAALNASLADPTTEIDACADTSTVVVAEVALRPDRPAVERADPTTVVLCVATGDPGSDNE